MLSLALAATLVGFGLLVFALMMANLPLAIACVVVCVVGLILLIVDTLRANKRGRSDDDEPLFTIRGRESAAREEPLEDEQDDGVPAPAVPSDNADSDAATTAAYGDQTASTWSLHGGQTSGGSDSSSGLGSLVAPASEHVSDTAPESGSGGFAPLSGGFEAAAHERGDARGGDVNDYLRSTGSFPAQMAEPSTPAVSETAVPETAVPEAVIPEPVGPEESASESAVVENRIPEAGVEEAVPAADEVPVSDVEPEAPTDPAPTREQPEPYVGRRRLAGDPTDNIVVRSASPDLPAMQFVWDDPDAQPKGDAPN
ncbi:hypothetical protein [Gordonia phthalatica]|uniref:Uncharacterized protein n=1 Tax=Gordonia phthalatica TaxID=1136941 RepID=A0A0N9NA07_9ACTN|nr:hypothetical protein [Gordonia phthalatica]ALG85138.1 hypothetical protein ACH46_12440 [Gordonia phthalatica]